MEANQYTFDAAFNNGPVNYPADCDRIRKVGAGMGIRMTQRQADEVWEWYSGCRSAQWLSLQDDDEIREAITDFINFRLKS